jgi:uncharacterized repeat protein (TIGR03803 family)
MLGTRILVIATMAAAASLNPMDAQAGKLTVLYNFKGGTDAAAPSAGLIYQGNILFGTSASGGGTGCFGDGCGTLFEVDPKTGAETVIYSFKGGTDGQGPEAPLVYENGALFGTTPFGGAAGAGTVFKFVLRTGTEKVLYSFAGGSDGANPQYGALVWHGGALYGTTQRGGNGAGTVFKIDTKTGTETLLHSFTGGSDGELPAAGLVYRHGTLYGTTVTGGTSGDGSVFKVDANTGAEAVLYSFTGLADGLSPQAGVIFHRGTLYGATTGGGASGYGNVFKLNSTTGAEAVLYSFTGGADGSIPESPLIHEGGALYGTTSAGGASQFGTVFSVNIGTGSENVVHSFTGGTDGQGPSVGLVDEGRVLYGTTQTGGANGKGMVFALTP